MFSPYQHLLLHQGEARGIGQIAWGGIHKADGSRFVDLLLQLHRWVVSCGVGLHEGQVYCRMLTWEGLCVRTFACEDAQLHPTVIWLEVFSMMTINVACIGRCLCSIGGWMAYTCANVLVSEVSTHYIICMLLT